MRGYSLIGVLAAMIILLAALLPLLQMQGRLQRAPAAFPGGAVWRAIEEDVGKLAHLEPGEIPPRRRFRSGHFVIARRPAKVDGPQWRVDYQVFLERDPERTRAAVSYFLYVPPR